MQLHRDTTVAALTQSAAIEDGKLVWKDSPLVRALEHGRVLVLDEADKASLEVRHPVQRARSDFACTTDRILLHARRSYACCAHSLRRGGFFSRMGAE
mmetsp:Transcript_2532/g.7153  ORF Transcript_2532/g.7153 Transcript_2532/m.7153 type:complete len:98 (-) Transcript_2532:5212-5505(-)|eukprot:scaffold96075_cov31-Tisochrysis_lutea.AAC.6